MAALSLTMSAGAQQAQKQKPITHSAPPAPFNPCTGNGLPPSSQMAPFAPGSPSDINGPVPKTWGGGVTCSNGKCRPTKENKDEQEMNSNTGPGLPLSPREAQAGKKNEGKTRNAFPLAKSEAAQKKVNKMNAPEPSAGQANPFPEEQSEAAQAARRKAAGAAPPQQGVYSSSDRRLPDVNALGNGPVVNDSGETHPEFDPALAKRDDRVGKYYLQTGDWAGAYGRYSQASRVDQEDLQAVIGLAIAADHLGKREAAIRNYKLYLEVMPTGKHSKEALKALKRLSKEK